MSTTSKNPLNLCFQTHTEKLHFFLTFMTPSGYLVQNTCKLLGSFTFREEAGFLHSGNLISKYLKVK